METPEQDPGGADRRDELQAELSGIASIDLDEVTVRPLVEERVLLGDVSEHESAEEVSCEVQLSWQDRTVRGVAQGGVSEHSILRTAAQATLDAVGELLPPARAALHVDWLEVLGPPSEHRPSVVHCAVAIRTAGGEDLLVGSAVIRGHPAEAAARATLDAVNRRLRMILED